MKFIIYTIVLLLTTSTFCQELPTLIGIEGENFDFGIEVQNIWKERDQLLKDIADQKKDWNNLTDKESKLLEKYSEAYSSMWEVDGGGCSWYCGAGNYTVNTSSFLKSQNENSYEIKNINDFSYQTSWVEGVKGYGIGEFIEFTFAPEHPRVNVIKIANGYIKSKKAWKDNSRVKKLKLFINDSAYAIINLKDVYSLQYVELEKPIGHSRKDFKRGIEVPEWKIKFEILEVYKGDKYDDTAISEIFFDGLDSH